MDVQVSVAAPAGIKAVGDLLIAIIVDVKAGKAAGAIVEDAVPGLISAMGLIGELGADLKEASVIPYAGLLAGQLVAALMAAPIVPAA